MLSKCANPSCSSQFLYLHRGKLFRMEVQTDAGVPDSVWVADLKKPPRRLEYFWLCGDCSRTMTVVFESGVGIKTRPITLTRAASL